MKQLWPIYLMLLAGCGVSRTTTTPQPKYERLNTDTVQNPDVLIMGDSIVHAWCSAAMLAQNPTWACQGTPAGVVEETSSEVLARFPMALAASPKTIVIEVGTWDVAFMQAPPSPGEVTGLCSESSNVCTDITAMVQQALAAKVNVVICTVPPWGTGPMANQINPVNPAGNLDELNQFVLYYGGGAAGEEPQDPPKVAYPAGISVLDVHAYLAVDGEDGQSDDFADSDGDVYVPSYTDDGINPNTAGGQVMTTALQAALNATQSQSKFGFR